MRQRARRSNSSDFSRQQVAAAPAEHRYPVRTAHRHINRERPICWSVAKLGRAFQQTGRTTNTAGKAASCAPYRGHYHGQESNAQPIGQVVRRLRARGSETDGQATRCASATSISRRQTSDSLSAFASCRCWPEASLRAAMQRYVSKLRSRTTRKRMLNSSSVKFSIFRPIEGRPLRSEPPGI